MVPCLKILVAVLLGYALNERAISKERWLQESGYGLMFHYEAFKSHTPESYNRAIDSFNVNHFVESVQSTKAGHIIFVIGQHWGKYCAPNSAYEKFLGVDTRIIIVIISKLAYFTTLFIVIIHAKYL